MNKHHNTQPNKNKSLRSWAAITITWSIICVIVFLLLRDVHLDTARHLAETEARTRLDAETTLRNWIAARGGVYVRPDNQVQSNPYLAHIADRDTVTREGKKLTLVSTSYLTRLLNNSFDSTYGNKGRISSQNPLNPINQAAEWEGEAYRLFEKGGNEFVGQIKDQGRIFVLVARALRAKPPCIQCHFDPIPEPNALLGALSVRVSLDSYYTAVTPNIHASAITLGGIWLLGTIALFIAYQFNYRRTQDIAQAEHEAGESRALFQMIADYATDWIFMRDANGRYRYISPACETISGYKVEEFYADPDLFLNIIHPKDRHSFSEHIHEADNDLIEETDHNPIKLRIITKSGQERWIAHNCRAVYDNQGKFIGVRGANYDITNQFNNEKVLIAQSRHAAMGEMINNIAHQWRQPISALGLVIQNMNYDFKEGCLDESAMTHYAKKAQDCITHMSNTIDDFRSFFREDQNPSKFMISSAIYDSVKIVHDSLVAHGIAIDIKIDHDIEITSFPNELVQVLLNLLANAKDAISARSEHYGKISITLRTGPHSVSIDVADNGGGIPNNVLPKIFDPYFTTKEEGSGIGLYMSRMIVEQHMHGKIEAQVFDESTHFIITLPLEHHLASATH